MGSSVALMFFLEFFLATSTNFANSINITECLQLWNCEWRGRYDPSASNRGNCVFWDPDDVFFTPSSQPPPGPLDIKARCSSDNVISPWLGLPAPQSTIPCLGLITTSSSPRRLSLFDCDELEIHDGDLDGFQYLEELIIQYGAIKYISPTAFCYTESLKVIDVFQDADGTGIYRYPEAFTGLSCKDETSSLAHNFSSKTNFLPNIEEISLSNIQFNGTIPEHAFNRVRHLRTLRFAYAVFSSNEGFQSFSVLSQLQHLQLSFSFAGVHDVQFFLSNVLPSLSNLETLWIDGAKLTRLIPSFFPNNLIVEEISFPNNLLTYLEAGTFKNLQRLRSLHLADNPKLGLNISQNFLDGTFSLESLNLKNCSLTSVNHFRFSDTIHLKSFVTSVNLVSEIPDLFNHFGNGETVLSDIESIDISRNQIRSIKNFTFSNLPRLVEIDLSSNQINLIESKAFYNLERIERIDLSNNALLKISKDSLFNIPSLDRLDLSHNFLTSFPKFPCHVNWELGPSSLPANIFLTDIRANNLQCDCNMHELFFGRYVPVLDCPFEPFDVRKTWPGKYELVNQRFHRDELICSSTRNYLIDDILDDPGLFSTNLTNSDWFRCPPKCDCFLHCQTNMNVTKCTDQNLTELPSHLDEGTNYLNLQGNQIKSLTTMSIGNLHNLVFLNLQDNLLDFVENDVFHTLPSLRHVDLSNNKLQEVQDGTFNSYSNSLETLDLSGNVISHLYPDSFVSLSKLKSLDISENEIKIIPKGLLDNLTSINTFFVSGNPLNCSCDILYLSNWYKGAIFDTNRTKLTTDVRDVDCTPFTNDSVLYDWIEQQERICNPIPTVQVTGNMTVVKVLTSIVIVMAIVCSSVLFIFKYQLEIRVIIFAKTGVRCFKPTNDDEEKEYDAFVSFSNQDDEFVLNELLPRLEDRQPAQWKMCVHQRDFAVGESIATNIVNAIDKSKRVIIVLSNEFLKSDWCSYEFRTAHSQALRERSRRIILIMMKDVNINKLDKELKAYISTNTYLKADDSLFWSKLEYALPEPRKCFNGNEGETNL